ncbi:hypothetical protein [Sporolactobacillus vineae]|nr:hypothetical protein [Sporolactobacillus vineae]
MNHEFVPLNVKMLPMEMREGLHRISHNPRINQRLNTSPLFLFGFIDGSR